MTLIHEQVPLAPLSSFGIGGTADFFAEVRTKEEWEEVMKFARDRKVPTVLLGGGNNVLFADEGIRGVVIRLRNSSFADLGGRRVEVEAGLAIGNLIAESRKIGAFGLEGLVGIPGTVGAAVRGNVGIPGCEIKDFVQEVEVWVDDHFEHWTTSECEFTYRGSRMKQEGRQVWGVRLQLSERQTIHMDEQMKSRLAKQPKGKTCGSFFKNPDPSGGVFAGRLVDECGLRGRVMGGAQISEQHGNWIMNLHGATCTDVLELARLVAGTVMKEKGILLEPEVMIYDIMGKVIGI